MQKQCGFTFIETVIVIAVLFMVATVILPSLSTYSRSETAVRINKDSELLLHSMNQFYANNCSEPVFPHVSIDLLKSEGFFVGDIAPNPLGSYPGISIEGADTNNPQFKVRVEFFEENDAKFVASKSSYAVAQGAVVIWLMQSRLSRTKLGVLRQIDREALGTPLC